MTSDDVHVFPTGDLIEHDVDSGDCPCGPSTEPVPRDDGSIGWVVVHHSLDGREFAEPDHTGSCDAAGAVERPGVPPSLS